MEHSTSCQRHGEARQSAANNDGLIPQRRCPTTAVGLYHKAEDVGTTCVVVETHSFEAPLA
eukprot:1630013-Alexandrium_andersonii.AAC.1